MTFPEPLPRRRAVLVTVISTKSNTLGDSATSSTARIEALDLDSGARTVVSEAADGHVICRPVICSTHPGNTCSSCASISARLTTLGEPVQLGDGSAEFGASNDGTLVYGVGLGRGRRELVWVDRRGREQPLGVPVAEGRLPPYPSLTYRIALDVPGPNRTSGCGTSSAR